jgi:hypothetical protein
MQTVMQTTLYNIKKKYLIILIKLFIDVFTESSNYTETCIDLIFRYSFVKLWPFLFVLCQKKKYNSDLQNI